MYVDEEFEELAESEYIEDGEDLTIAPPPDFKHGAVRGGRPVLGKVDLVPGEVDNVKYVKWLEVFTHKGRTVLNGMNPYSWSYIARVYCGIFSFPVRVEMNPDIPEDVREIVLPLLRKEILGR